mmetsp:Transcript_972/g.1983  ORF Transcript_972/g.1983 Transcript_972/m.1983 type:complete len:418 (-) Transcript_972:82-1335(-)|eukprot:CAMPEP_0168735298 /NCGR_PEP_ID=MMETSP0724-20121128/9260_1 /TAXON_ID=265536 /ORGANISM="Amphiprora sp., Strain CCMP467" /LENGTH=417 /DNA_ID=CAMNT_0008782435 /DNA_START=40 /DNA_END=1293 /DNA_ORIENTATION=+
MIASSKVSQTAESFEESSTVTMDQADNAKIAGSTTVQEEDETSSCSSTSKDNSSSSSCNVGGALGENDVICARCSSAHKHPGNRRYNQLIEDNHIRYQTSTSREEKARITNMVIEAVETECGGRFVKCVGKKTSEKGSGWMPLDKFSKREKVTHALRNAKQHRLRKDAKERCLHVLRLKEAKKQRREGAVVSVDHNKDGETAGSSASSVTMVEDQEMMEMEQQQQQQQQQQVPTSVPDLPRSVMVGAPMGFALPNHLPSSAAATLRGLPTAYVPNAAALAAEEELFLAQMMQRRLQRRQQYEQALADMALLSSAGGAAAYPLLAAQAQRRALMSQLPPPTYCASLAAARQDLVSAHTSPAGMVLNTTNVVAAPHSLDQEEAATPPKQLKHLRKQQKKARKAAAAAAAAANEPSTLIV